MSPVPGESNDNGGSDNGATIGGAVGGAVSFSYITQNVFDIP